MNSVILKSGKLVKLALGINEPYSFWRYYARGLPAVVPDLKVPVGLLGVRPS